jgi:ABC-2 type transport system permease protein
MVAIDSIIVFPIMFTSRALLPAAFLPGWMQTVSNYNPFSYAANAIRALIATGFDWSVVLPAYAVIALMLVATWSATLCQFRKIVR